MDSECPKRDGIAAIDTFAATERKCLGEYEIKLQLVNSFQMLKIK